ncbi:MAG: ABC transporter ATP-binding protein [Halanaerobiales bacterium]
MNNNAPKNNKNIDQKEYDSEKINTNTVRRGPGRGPGRGPAVGKPKNLKKSVKKLMSYLRPYFFLIVIALILAMAATILTIIGPGKIRQMTDIISRGITSTIDLESVKEIGIFLAIIYSLSALLNYIQAFLIATVSQKMSKELRTKISKKINRLKLEYFDTNTVGDILSRVTNDVDLIGQTLNHSIGTLVTSLTLILGSVIMMYLTNWMLATSAIASTSIGFHLMLFMIKKSQKYFIAQQRELGRINGHIEEIYTGHTIVKVYNGEEKALNEFRAINEDLYNSAWKSQFVSGLMRPIMSFTGNFGYVVVSVFGSALAIQGSITFGVVVAFMLYVRLFTRPLSQLAQAATRLQSALAASERVSEFLAEEELRDEKHKGLQIKTSNVRGNIKFENVTFGYAEEKKVIKNFNFIAQAGQKIAIVGPTGAGKTTMVNLLMKFYEIDEGNIYIDGYKISDLKRENIHKLFSMVLQDSWLFEGSIEENIVYSKEGVIRDDVIKAEKAVGLHYFVMTLPNGYDTILDDKMTISSGQKQLITIARAMIENAPLLILDEATSSVDTRTELIIQKAMDRLMKNKTSFIIAHRLSTIKNADAIIVMNEGEIVESGTHDELLSKRGFYYNIYNSQFENAS